jgi:hypothetical protein
MSSSVDRDNFLTFTDTACVTGQFSRSPRHDDSMRLKVSFFYDVTLTFRHNVPPPSSDIRTLVIAAEPSSKYLTPPTHMTSSQWERQSCCCCLPVIGLCSEQHGNPAAFLSAGFRLTLPPPRPFRAYPMATGITFLGVTFSLNMG